MSTKALISATLTGTVAAGDVTFDITDPADCKSLKIDGLTSGDSLNVVRRNYAEDGWEQVTDEGRSVQLNHGRRTAPLNEVGTYSVEGWLAGTRTLWTEAI